MEKITNKNNIYTPEFKIQVAEQYLSGNYGGYRTLAKLYKLRIKRVQDWVTIYREHGKEGFYVERRGKSSNLSGGRPKTINYSNMTLEEKVKYLEMENAILKKAKALQLKK